MPKRWPSLVGSSPPALPRTARAVTPAPASRPSSGGSTDILTKSGVNGLVPAILAAVALLVTGWKVRSGKTGWTFVTGTLTIVFATAMVFMGLYPRILISNLDPAWSLTVTNASSSPYTLKVMTIVASIFVPIILVYLGWTYWVFRKRVEAKPETLTY